MKRIYLFSFLFFIHGLLAQNNVQFARSIASSGSLAGNNGVTVKDVLIDSMGNSYLLGYYFGTVDFDPGPNVMERTSTLTDGFVVKLDTGGNLIWLNTEAVVADQEISAGVLNLGSTFSKKLAVVFKNSLNSFCLKQLDLDTGVTTFTSASFSTNATNNAVNIHNITVNTANNATTYFIGGSFAGSLTLGSSTIASAGALDAFTASFSTVSESNPFSFQWANRYGGPGADEISDIRVSSTSSISAVGYFSQTADFDGNSATNTISRTSNGLKDAFYLIASTSNGRPSGTDSVVAFGGSGNDAVNSLSGEIFNVILCGYFSGTIDFDPGTALLNKTSAGGTDGFVARFNTGTPDLIWVNTVGGTANDESADVIYNPGTTRIYHAYYLGNSANGKGIGLGSYYSDGSTNTTFGGLLSSATPTSENYPVAIASEGSDLYIAGIFNDEVNFGTGVGSNVLSNSNSGNDAFITKRTYCGFPAITPVVQASGNFCSNEPVTFTIANPNLWNNAQWFWYSGSCGGTPVGTGQTLTITPQANTTYYVRGEGGCASNSECSAAYNFTFNPSPSAVVIQNQTILQATEPDAIYQWINCTTGSNIPGANGQSFSPASVGNYAVLVTNAQGCQSQSNCVNFGCISGTKPVLSGDRYICNEVYITVPVSISSGELNNNASWAWYSGSCGGTLLGYGLTRDLPIGTYYVKAVGGCAAAGLCSDPFTVSYYSPQFNITQVGNTLQVTDIPDAIYAWTACNDNSVTLGNQAVFTPSSPGSYKVYVGYSLSAHCAGGAGCFDYNGPLETVNFTAADVFSVYPNPAKSDFEILGNEPIVEVVLYDLLGSKVISFGPQLSYSTDELAAGMYLVLIRGTSHTVMKKILKE